MHIHTSSLLRTTLISRKEISFEIVALGHPQRGIEANKVRPPSTFLSLR